MGNQGMTNWKFSAFFAIALMLVAGLFTSTAVALDGTGTVAVEWDADLNEASPGDAAASNPLDAASAENTVQFTYTVPDTVPEGADGADYDMSSGAFRLVIPSGFTVTKKWITISDDTTVLYDTNADGKVDTAAGEDADGDTADTRKRVQILPVSGDNVSSVEVSLDATWADGGTLTIRFGNVGAPTPSRLPFRYGTAATDAYYEEYQFTSYSKKKDGTLTRLKVTEANPEPQPYVRVGSVAAGTGTVAVTPATVIQGETGLDFRLVYTAPGPIYNGTIVVTVPDALVDGTGLDGDNSTNDATFRADITVSERGGVDFGETDADVGQSGVFAVSFSDRTITIEIDDMHKGDQVRVFYEDIKVGDPSTTPQMWNVATSVDGAATPTDLPDGDQKGTVRQRAGSGEVTISPSAVEVNSTRDYTIAYKAATVLENVYLVVRLPAAAFVSANDEGVVTALRVLTEARTGTDGALNYGYIPDADDQTLETDGAFVAWKIAKLGKGSTFRKTIKRLRASNSAGVHDWDVQLVTTEVTAASSFPDTGAIASRLYILQADANPDNPDVTFSITTPADATFPAASEQTITFTFAPVNTPIKAGNVSFRIPSGWTAPTKTDGAVGEVTVAATILEGDTAVEDKHISVSGMEVTVSIEALSRSTDGDPSSVVVTYTKGTVQHNAEDEVEIRGYFKSGASLPERVSNIRYVDITNVASGSGMASITPHSAEAGSTDNDMTVRFGAQGSMDGGQVRLDLPDDWGKLQETNASGANYARVQVSSGGSLRDTAVGDDRIVAYLDEFGKGDILTFSFSDLEAETDLGIAEFIIRSAGRRGGGLHLVGGEKRPDDADTPLELLGKVYISTTADDASSTEINESYDGLLRVEVTGGGDGSGKATVAIVSSKAGPAQYDTVADDGTVSTRISEEIHAGDDEAHLKFVYTPIETIGDGELQFTVPSGWSAPQADSSREPGFTDVGSDGSVGSVIFSGNSLNLPIYSLDKGGTVTINYGTQDGGAVVPTTSGETSFDIKIKGSETGSLVSLASGNMEQITIRPQASGRGTAEIDTDGDVHSGDTERTFTITYTAIGQIVGGSLKVTVPDGDDWADATAASIDVSSGSATYGGDLSETALADNEDVGGVNDLVISNINMGAGQSLTITYATDITAKAGDVAFKIGFDGGRGPDEGFTALPDLTVTVMDARAGSGDVDISQMPIVAASTGNELTITYTVAGQISELREFKVRVPAGWSPPSAAATAEANVGTYTVAHTRANDEGVYGEITTDVEEQAPVKADGATADDPTMYMVARVKSEQTVERGDRITFTYENATAPAMPEKSTFKFFFDGTQVLPDLDVIVQSAEGATALGLEAADFTIEDGPTTVTVKLMVSDGSVATSNDDTVVSLTADGGTIDPASVTITAGTYHAETELSATASGHITITASATGLTDGTTMVTANTNNVMITNVSLSQMVAKAGDTVMVTAEGSAAQDGKFSVGSVITDMALTEDEAGSYTGSFNVVADLQDGMHTVTVSLNGTSDDSASITIDTVAPTATAASSADEVANGDMVTISATADDGTGSGIASVMADVSMLDTTQADMVALTMGDDGSYSAEITISEANEAANGMHDVTVTATDMAGNMSEMVTVSVTLNNELTFTSTLPAGISLFSVPLSEEGLATVGDLEAKLGDNVNLLIAYDGTNWNSRSSDVAITGSLGILVSMAAETSVTFTGYAWEDSAISLAAGSNLVGLPVNDASVTNISDIAGLFGAGVVTNVIASSGGEFQLIAAAGDPGDGPVAGDAAYLVMASTAGSATLTGDGWENGEAAGAAPIALSGYTVGSQTPVLDVLGSVVDELTGLEKEGFRVKVKNLSTKASLSNVSTDGYNMTFVDLADSYAARVGDVLEVSADSPNPLIGVKPVRYVVTVDDVKSSLIQLEDLIVYEIPAETELLRNYPNPFNPETWIPYHLSEDADVSLTIYDVNGALVRDINVGHQTAAKYDTRSKAIYWDGRNQFGEQVASGIYFYSLSAGDFSATRKMVILK